MATKKPQDNVAFIKDLMTNSEHGALIQVFVIQALDQFSKKVAASKPADYPENGMVHIPSWIGCGKEVQAKLAERLNAVR